MCFDVSYWRKSCNGCEEFLRVVGTGGVRSRLREGHFIATSSRRFTTHKVSKGILTHLMAAVALTWSRERWGISPLDAVVSRPGVSTFIVDFVASSRCKVREPSRGLKWEAEGEEEGRGETEKVSRGGPILPGLIMDFPHSNRPTHLITTISSTMTVPHQFHLRVQRGKSSHVCWGVYA